LSVWLCIPSARPPEEAEKVLKLWRERGYKIALWRDGNASLIEWSEHNVDLCVTMRTYPGYGRAVDMLVQYVIENREDAEWFIAAGDDTEPDPNHSAEEIARECSDHFYSLNARNRDQITEQWDTFGVMQPTGDRWHEGVGGFSNAPIDRVAGSAWYGREYCRRMYQGNGPLFSGYKHMYVDEEAQEVALRMGVFWQRRDLIQRHNHWGRGENDKSLVRDPVLPPHLLKWNTKEHWDESKKLFLERRAAGFPGHEPL
jgi:hypothetical protein